MNDKWEKEGLSVLKEIHKVLGISKNLDIKNLRDDEIFFLKLLGMNSRITKELNNMNKIPLDGPPQEYMEKLEKNLSKIFEKDPQLERDMEDHLIYYQTVEYSKIRLSRYRGDRFETSLIKKFLEEFKKAEKVNKHRVKESFEEIFKYLKHLPTPDDLYLLSQYHELGIDPEKIETDTMQNLFTSIFDQFFTKKDKLFALPVKKFIDCVRDFVSRFGRALEPYLIAIMGSIYNLQQVWKKQEFNKFEYSLGHYKNILHLKHSKEGDYLDYRNATKHNQDFDVKINYEKKKITIIFKLKSKYKDEVKWRKNVKMDLDEFESLFRQFRKFLRLFLFFYKAYIKSFDEN